MRLLDRKSKTVLSSLIKLSNNKYPAINSADLADESDIPFEDISIIIEYLDREHYIAELKQVIESRKEKGIAKAVRLTVDGENYFIHEAEILHQQTEEKKYRGRVLWFPVIATIIGAVVGAIGGVVITLITTHS